MYISEYAEVEFLDHNLSVRLALLESARLFPKAVGPFPQQCMSVPVAPHPQQHLVLSMSF